MKIFKVSGVLVLVFASLFLTSPVAVSAEDTEAFPYDSCMHYCMEVGGGAFAGCHATCKDGEALSE
jgi:hypothetical protein